MSTNTPLLQFMHNTVGKVNNIKSLAELIKSGKLHPDEVKTSLDNIDKLGKQLDIEFSNPIIIKLSHGLMSAKHVLNFRIHGLNALYSEKAIDNIIHAADKVNHELDNYYTQNKPKK